MDTCSDDGSVFPSAWSENEIELFHRAIKRFGTQTHIAVRAIAYSIGTKTPVQVLGILHKLEERAERHKISDSDDDVYILDTVLAPFPKGQWQQNHFETVPPTLVFFLSYHFEYMVPSVLSDLNWKLF
jgi:hypothetical protein